MTLETFKAYALVGLGSALGGMARLWVSTVAGRRWGEDFPWGTLLVNISGSFLIGCFAGLAGSEGRGILSRHTLLFFASGLCGGYTTFSAFSLQTLHLARDGHWLQASGNVALSVVLCLLATTIGLWLGQSANR
jgi:CrcB protein